MDTWIIGHTKLDQLIQYLLAKASADHELCVCFDYFDTLVVRDVEPEYTKQLAARLLSTIISSALSPEDLYAIRRNLEKRLCEESVEAGGELENYLHLFSPHYLQIIREKEPNLLSGWNEKRFTNLILDIELAVEIAVQQPCREVVNILSRLKEEGLRTVLISDFYLPSSHFLPMLKNIGLYDLFEDVYVSADYGLAKGSGRLYTKVCTELNRRPDQLIMIGDNPHSDVHMAKQQGIAAIQLQRPRQKEFYTRWHPKDLADQQLVISRFTKALHNETPFHEMANSLWFFIYLLFHELIKERVKHVFFFSKEGEFLKKLFDRFQEDLYGHIVISSYYLLVSRKSTFIASLRPLGQEDFSRLFNHYRDISLRDFLLSLNLEESVASEICRALDLDLTTRLPDLPNRQEFQVLISDPSFQAIYDSRRRKQRKNFISYLDSYGIDYAQQGLTIVDVGWKGSIQDNLYHILDGKVCIRGYYIGSIIAPSKNESNRKSGMLFDDSPSPTSFFHVYNNNRSLFEMVLGATHGSADGYFAKDEYEHLPNDHQRIVSEYISSENGELYVATLDLPEERRLFKEVISPLQERIDTAFVLQNKAYIKSGCSLPQPEWFARQHARMVFKPRREEVDIFERLYHLENFGIFEYTDFMTGEKLPVRQRLRNFKNIMKNQTILESGIWPPIILRRLGIGFYRHIDGYKRFSREFKQRIAG